MTRAESAPPVDDPSDLPGVTRDAWGVPRLCADDVVSLARLQGRVTAHDRAWQMEHLRWRMEGRTAEHLGGTGLRWDRLARQARIEETARRCFEALDAETRAFVEAYVDGVNEGLPAGLARAPELRLLGLEDLAAGPRAWEPWTPLGIFWAVHLLFGTFPRKLFNAHVARTLGPEWVGLLSVEGDPESGSNAWVVGGHRTRSGLPLLAGDPHRTLELPNCYQQVGLVCPEFDVVGFTFPGVPGVQHFAHAGSVAWGITNAMADYQDLAVEQLRRARGAGGGLEARSADGWEAVSHHDETVLVRGGQPVLVPVVVTPRGPVVTGLDSGLDAALDPDAADGARPATCSLRTPAHALGELGFAALLPLLRSRTTADVAAALEHWVEPVNSALVADVDGDVRHLVVGRVPARHGDNQWFPVPAWEPRHAWAGWMTASATAVDDLMVSANDRASGGGLGVDYATPWRADRIRALVGERHDLDADAFAAIHVDTRNGQAPLAQQLVEAVDPASLGADAATVRETLLAWDGHSDAGSRGAAVFAQWRHELVGWFAEHPALAPVHEPTGHSRLLDSWLDVPLQIGRAWHRLALEGDRHGIDVAEGVRTALVRVAALGDSVTVWGDRHWFDPVHALDGWGAAPTLRQEPLSGDKGCVLAAGSAPGVTDRCYVGPAARYVWDLADRDASRWVVPHGASGVDGDPHVDDQLGAWAAGRLGVVGPHGRLPGSPVLTDT